jgi:hypothetical protein
MEQNKDGAPPILSYAAPPRARKRLHPLIRVLVAVLAIVFLMPTINIIAGVPPSDGPITEVIGIIVTLCIASYFAFISITGRFRFRRPEKNAPQES